MKTTLRIFTVIFAIAMMVSVFAACGNETPAATNNNDSADATENINETVPFIAPPDQVGKVVSADAQLITWHPYEVNEDVIDFKGLKIDSLGKPGEMALFYLEKDVTYYILVDGTLEKTTAEAIVKDCVVGVTTLEEGVQEVYILSVPVEEEEEIEEVILEEEAEEATN